MTQPQLQVRGAARRAAADDDVSYSSDDDTMPDLEPMDALDPMDALEPMDAFEPTDALGPALPLHGRAPPVPARRFTISRAQGNTRPQIGVDIGPAPGDGRHSRMGSRWSSSASDGDVAPDDRPEPGTGAIAAPVPQVDPPFALPWARQALGSVTSLEQYLVIIANGERLFFRMSILIEQTAAGFRPTVNVDFMNYVPQERTLQTDVWLLFAAQLESTLLREVDRAFRRVGATRAGTV